MNLIRGASKLRNYCELKLPNHPKLLRVKSTNRFPLTAVNYSTNNKNVSPNAKENNGGATTKWKFNTFCSYCGHKNTENQKGCVNCGNRTYLNPIPVVVGIIQLNNKKNSEKKVLTIKRGIEPHVGGIAFPGGFLEERESWQVGLSREVREEIGITIDSAKWKLENVHSVIRENGRDNLLLFGSTELQIDNEEVFLKSCSLSREAPEIKLLSEPIPLCFSFHDLELNRYFNRLNNRA